MRARPGFTVTELLIAAALGLFIAALGTQQTFQYFRLQGTLVGKTELRHATQQAQDRLSQLLRQALYVVPVGTSEYVLVLPTDVDRCGYVCEKDTFDVVWWTVALDPMHPENGYLNEKRITTPAFEMTADTKQLKSLFEKFPGSGRRVASAVEAIAISNEAPGLYRTHVTVVRGLDKKGPMKLTFTELVAARSKPRVQGVPKLETVLKAAVPGGKG